MVGAVISSIVNVAVVETESGFIGSSSVAVKVTDTVPVAPHAEVNEVKSLLHTKEAVQASDALAPPLLANHALRAAVLPAPSHCTVIGAAGSIIPGATLGTVEIVTTSGATEAQLGMASSVTVTK